MVLNFTTPRYALLFLNSEIYIVHVINYEWSRSVNFLLRMFCMRYKNVFFQYLQPPNYLPAPWSPTSCILISPFTGEEACFGWFAYLVRLSYTWLTMDYSGWYLRLSWGKFWSDFIYYWISWKLNTFDIVILVCKCVCFWYLINWITIFIWSCVIKTGCNFPDIFIGECARPLYLFDENTILVLTFWSHS